MKKTYIAPELEVYTVAATLLSGSMEISDEVFGGDLNDAHSAGGTNLFDKEWFD